MKKERKKEVKEKKTIILEQEIDRSRGKTHTNETRISSRKEKRMNAIQQKLKLSPSALEDINRTERQSLFLRMRLGEDSAW